jgi:hypothetical protein
MRSWDQRRRSGVAGVKQSRYVFGAFVAAAFVFSIAEPHASTLQKEVLLAGLLDDEAGSPVSTDNPAIKLCRLIENAANTYGIPSDFFTRLLWKESRFQSDALSPKGAQGIAQFMPGTAAERGLLDPFDVATAIPASASYLAELKAQFGNLGLAAAAYNAGPQRVSDWLADESSLPFETQDFVLSITGTDAETWSEPEFVEALVKAATKEESCTSVVALLKVPSHDLGPTVATETAPWGVQVAGNFSRTVALRSYERVQSKFTDLIGHRPPMVIGTRMRGPGTRVFYRVRVPAKSREEATDLCGRIQELGGSCIVLRT